MTNNVAADGYTPISMDTRQVVMATQERTRSPFENLDDAPRVEVSAFAQANATSMGDNFEEGLENEANFLA